MCDETTTQENKTEVSPEEQGLQDFIMNDAMPAYMKGLGYDLSFDEKTTPKNPEKIASLQSQIDGLTNQLANTKDPKIAANIQKQIDNANKQLGDEYADTTTTIEPNMVQNEMGKKMDAVNEKIFGYKEKMIDATMTSALKYMGGDFSITPEQGALVDKTFGAIKDSVEPLLDNLKTEYETTGKNMLEALSGVVKEIEATGVSVAAGFTAIGEQLTSWKEGVSSGLSGEQTELQKTGQNVKAALQGVKDVIVKGGDDAKQALEQTFTLKRAMFESDMKDNYKAVTKSNAAKAAALGRSPMDPQFQFEMLGDLTDKISKTSLSMAIEESMQKVGLVKDTSGKLESLAYQNAAFEGTFGAENQAIAAKKTDLASKYGQAKTGLEEKKTEFAAGQGAKKETIEEQKVGIAQQVGAGAESVAASKVALGKELATGAAALKTEIGMGIPAKQMGIGMDTGSFFSALQQQDLANKGTMATAPLPLAGLMSSEATKTGTTTTSGSVFGDIMGGIGVLAGGAGSVMGGIGKLK